MKLSEIRAAYIAEGYSYLAADSRTSQDIVIWLISNRITTENVCLSE